MAAILIWLAAGSLPLYAQFKLEKIKGKNVVAGQVLIKFRTTSSQNLASAALSGDVDSYRPLGKSGVYVLHSRSKTTLSLLRTLSSRSDVMFVEPDHILQGATLPDDPRLGDQYAVLNTGQAILNSPGVAGADLGLDPAWNLGTGTRDHVIAILDSGVDYAHPDLDANVWTAAQPFTVQLGGRVVACPAGSRGFNLVKRNCDPMDDHNHGSQLAGIIGAVGDNGLGITGVNWTANILALKFLDYRLAGTISGAIEAIGVAIQMKAAGVANIRVLVAGWGDYGYSKALAAAIEQAFRNEILFVAAAGNQGSDNDVRPFYPAGYVVPNVVSVTATDHKDELGSLSNFGDTSVHVGAPGMFVLSTIVGGYDYGSGTSLAAAHVAGTAALALSLCPDLNTMDLRTNLFEQGTHVPALTGFTTTGGRVNAGNSVLACSGPAYRLTTSASTRTVARGQTTSFNVMVNPVREFTGDVQILVGGLPDGTFASVTPGIVNAPGAATITITVGESVAPGTYFLNLLSLGNVIRSAPFWLEVTRQRPH
ncbi:MAG: S8 family serine peptidase [Acidobacteria bacterium]|nr:S8 family serine peptidase [Acidobacteriota bacterium]